ncbi:MAG TPA: SDR family oxidoreductase [Steroidobacteraceae bacterium]|jgi:NAD(P)-dependent dehydrogenase (short-subunit alcohol dehydrogenase family)|nr:SDR family oxidoreductase [Steroidobacteraceae bacterium]
MEPKQSNWLSHGSVSALTDRLFAPGDWTGRVRRMQPDYGESGYQGSGRLLGRRALITGGSSGPARAAAIAFAREGADVAVNYLPAEQTDAEEVIELMRETGRKAVPLPGDLRDEEFCNQLVVDAAHELGGLDILVSNASRQQAVADIAQMSTEQFDATFRTNIYAMFWLTKAALPYLGPGSSIINTSSPKVFDSADILLDYSATKGAIMVFTRSLARQLAPRGIRVNAVAPGPIWTPRHFNGGEEASIGLHDIGAEPAAEPADDPPVELASTYVLLASHESSYATGQIFGAIGRAAGA